MLKQTDKNTYENKHWKLTFESRFSFSIAPKMGRFDYNRLRLGVWYYTGNIELIGRNKSLPRPILNQVLEICKARHKQGLMPNKQ